MTPKTILTTAEFAASIGLSRQTVSAYICRGMIPAARFDTRLGRWMIPAGAEVVRRKRGRKPKGDQ